MIYEGLKLMITGMSTVILFLIVMIFTVQLVAKLSREYADKELANMEIEKKKQAEQRAKQQARERAKKQVQIDKTAAEHEELKAHFHAQLESRLQSAPAQETVPLAVFSAAIDMYESEQQ